MRRILVIFLILFSAACAGSAGSTETAEVAEGAEGAEARTAVPGTLAATAVIDTAPATQAPAAGATGAPTGEAVASPTGAPTGAPAASPTAVPTASPPASPPAQAQEFPDPAAYGWLPAGDGLDSPVGLANAGDGSGRLFVLEQAGRIRLVQDGQLLPEPFLDITDRVGAGGNEQGLLGLVFHPQYAQNGFFYVNYTDRDGDTHISRFSVAAGDPDRADPGSEAQVLFVDQPYPNHNGGALAFGPDGFLYIGLGDGGAAGDPQGNGQSPQALLGKILRLDVTAPIDAGSGEPYAIPPGNPFAGGGGAPEIWALGLRNPWRFSFDRLTGDLFVGDVGQNSWEEIDFIPAGSPGGLNLGWDVMEGLVCFESPDCSQQGLVQPVAVYATHDAGGCAVTGGYVYRGPSMPEWQGIYLYADFCNGQVWGLRPLAGGWDNRLLFSTDHRITSFGEDEAGELYLVDRQGGLFRLGPSQ